MSSSTKPSPVAGVPGATVEVEIPSGLFFDAVDYNPCQEKSASLLDTQARVVRHRSKVKASIALMLEDLGKIASSVHAADRQGNAAPHWDSAVALMGRLQDRVTYLAKQIDNAERRYEEFFQPPAVVAEGLVVKPGVVLTGVLQVGPSSVKPAKPSTMAERVRRSS